GMGTVYAAIDTALERRVAVKLIGAQFLGDAEAAMRFECEARTAASIGHPNIVTVHDFGVSGGQAYLVMELLDGATLRETLHRDGSLPAERALHIFRGICAAVEAAHRRQIVHRDLKPENIFVLATEDAELAKVLDFGIAKFLPAASSAIGSQVACAGVMPGPLTYMALWQRRGAQV